jgi:pyruvate/2-oxoglutarate dehydrogenase complex dihydrolipoamide acyltransferase (E2) component
MKNDAFRIKHFPLIRRKWIGTTSVSAVGVFGRGSGWGIGLPNQTISFTIGGISERPVLEGDEIKNHRFLNITISMDHDIVDGAPAARFTSSLKRRIEFPQL